MAYGRAAASASLSVGGRGGSILRQIFRGEHDRLVLPLPKPSRFKRVVFINVLGFISQPLTKALDAIFTDRHGMHYDRLDGKFRDVDYLWAVSDFEIIEINGAGSESIHIWDRDASLGEAARGAVAAISHAV